MFKNTYFLKKNPVKIASGSGDPPPSNPRLPPAAGGSGPRPPRCYPAYYYNCVEFISSS